MTHALLHARFLLRLTPLVLTLGLGACEDRNRAPAQGDAPEPAATEEAAPAPGNLKVSLTGTPLRTERHPDGLVIEIFAEGTGPGLEPGQTGVIDFEMRLADGRVIDSSERRRAHLRVPIATGHAVPGLLEGLRGMRVGESRRLLIPSALAYGDVGRPPIPPKSDLTFDVTLIDIAQPD